MADSRWRVAGLTSTLTFNKTEAEVAEILADFAADKIGEPPAELTTQAQINQWKLDQAHKEVRNYIVREAFKNRLRRRREATNLEATVAAEVEL